MAELRVRCAAASLQRGEPLHATASRVRRWAVVEQPGPWGRTALLESRLDEAIGHRLRSEGERHGVRVVLARRPGWRGAGDVRKVFLASSGASSGWIEELEVDDGGLAELDLSALRSGSAPGLGSPGPPSLYLVCTHGRHDACCADFGRPVVRALAEAGVADVWECSHIGGDRFAANVVALPSGVYLGRVPPDGAAAMVADLSDGLLDLDHYRGRSCHPTLVQAAEVAARRELGERRLDGLVVEAATAIDADQMVTRLRRRGGGADVGSVEVHVRRRRVATAPLTCAGGTGRPWAYEVLALRTAV